MLFRSGKPEGLAAAIDAAKKGAQVAPIFVRQAMDAITLRAGGGGDQFAQSLEYYTKRLMIMPIYIIVAGTQAGEGGIITRNATAAGTCAGPLAPLRTMSHIASC